ncbi:class I SAM-dependent methyltransferase [Gammaproteobacteria bacterium]|nr:class I SAM-dependent methyltransferase [Gammaproteobacteria bacterium]
MNTEFLKNLYSKRLLACVTITGLITLYSCNDVFRSKVINAWFDIGAYESFEDDELHKKSQWKYLSESEFNAMINDGVSKLNPPLQNHASIFDLGMGVGAAFKAMEQDFPDLDINGSDFSSSVIKKAKTTFPSFKDNFHIHDMTLKHPMIKDNAFDHVFSFGALAMYLSFDQMIFAIQEAIRITKPGGSLLFTHFIEPNGKPRRSIVQPVKKSQIYNTLSQMNLEDIRIEPMIHEGDRYQVHCRKPKNTPS